MKCFFGHKGKWEIIEKGDVLYGIDKHKIGMYMVQRRVCSECNFTSIKKSIVTV